MFKLTKLGKIFTRNTLLLGQESVFGSFSSPSNSIFFNTIFYQSKEYFGRAPQPKMKKNKERTSAPAYSDDKAAKLSKAEEEAELKKKKAEARAGGQQQKGPAVPPRTQLDVFEAKFDDKRFEEEADKIKKRGLFLLDEEKAPTKEVKPKTPAKWPEVTKPRKTLNDVVRKDSPSLRRKTVDEFYNTEEEVNIKFWKNMKPVEPKPDSKRSGLMGIKVGMTAVWDKWGARHALTVLQVDRCQVVQVKTKETDGHYALQLGIGERNIKKVKKPEIGHFMRADVPPKIDLKEFPVSPDCLLPVGYQLSVRHFTPGQYIDCQGITSGKGFQGAMYRWGFKGQPASHGNSLSHRALGATGMRQDPGRVFKNKKMAGRMGGKVRTTQNLQVYKIDVGRSLIFIKGAVPGKPGTVLYLKDAVKKVEKNEPYLNYPTFIPQPGVKYAEQMIMKAPTQDPWEVWLHDNDVVEAPGE